MTTLARALLLSALPAIAVLAAPAGALAQPVRPNILVIFDTSTSMLATTGCPAGATNNRCDGSEICNGQGQASRLYRLKEAIRETLKEVGTDEANFGLARFPQEETPATNRACFRGHYVNAGDGCKTSAANESADGAWFTPSIAEEFVPVPVTSTLVPAGAGAYDPAGANVATIYRWLDNVEVSNGVAMTNPEIRSGGQGTPLANSLLYTRLYFEKFVKPSDPKRGCRKDIAIFVTDGDESCNGAAATRAEELYNAGVELYVVVQSGEDGNTHNQMADRGSGGKRKQSIKVDFTNPTATKQVLVGIIAESVPPSESCNGKDDDCDGRIDELPLPGVGDQCLCPGLIEGNVGRGMCKRGATVCKAAGPGSADIACEGCVLPSAELCNGLDDDCDGDVDEDFGNLGKACDNMLKGACLRKGIFVCAPGGAGTVCDAPTSVTGTPEVCNGIDDDCNGLVDDGAIPGEGQDCGANLGVCMGGKTKCDGGKFVCVGQPIPGTDEICNAKDDNCNGIVDESIKGVGGMCACAPHTLETLSRGECKPGTLACKGREPLDCEGCVAPRGEICDCKDNNCNGQTDEDNPCGKGFACVACKCEIACQAGEFRCPPGYACDEKSGATPVCRSLKCAGKVCQPGWICEEGTGECTDPCAGVTCKASEICRDGRCLDCYTTGCPAGQMCTEGRCAKPPCEDVTCGADAYCDNGKCIALCRPGCATGQRCVDGRCAEDPCATGKVTCGAGQLCDPASGACKADVCSLKTCLGQTCVPATGQCKDDPCAKVTCPNGCYRCEMTSDGLPQCTLQEACAPTTTLVATRGGSCACRVGGAGEGSGLAAVVALGLALGLALRRRGRHTRQRDGAVRGCPRLHPGRRCIPT